MCENCPPYVPVNSSKSIIPEYQKQIQENAAFHFRLFLETLGFDLHDPNMKDTPERVSRMYVEELFKGCYNAPPKFTAFDLSQDADNVSSEMIVISDIDVRSVCSHHLLPIIGKAYVGVLLKKRQPLPGLSKYARIVDHFSRRPQLQEQLTKQVHAYLSGLLKFDEEEPSIIVVIKASHMCMSLRGPENTNAMMTTSQISGSFLAAAVRNEFFSLANIK